MPGGSFRHAARVKVHDNDCQGNGRMGVAMLDGLDGFEIANNVMGGITWYSLDVENNGHVFAGVPAGVTGGSIHHNRFGPVPYGRGPTLAPLAGISAEPTGIAFTITGASSGTVVIPVDNIEVAFNQTTDPAWPDFRYGIYTPSRRRPGSTCMTTCARCASDAGPPLFPHPLVAHRREVARRHVPRLVRRELGPAGHADRRPVPAAREDVRVVLPPHGPWLTSAR
jgi:hypothetical protein